MKYRIFLIIPYLTLCICLSSAQQLKTEIDSVKKPQTIWQMAKYDTRYTLKSVGHAFTKPLHWKGKDFAKLGILLGGTAAISLADEAIRDFGWYFVSPQNYFMVNAGLYGFGLFTKNEKIRKTSVLIISSSITTGLIQTITKNAIGRARPNHRDDPYAFSSFANDSGFRSFPSGHTVLSITMAHSIAKQFENPWVKAGIYTVGAIPPISRLIDDAHWFTDVAFSAALSIIIVDAIDKFLFEENVYDYPIKRKMVSWNLRFSTNQIGFVGTF